MRAWRCGVLLFAIMSSVAGYGDGDRGSDDGGDGDDDIGGGAMAVAFLIILWLLMICVCNGRYCSWSKPCGNNAAAPNQAGVVPAVAPGVVQGQVISVSAARVRGVPRWQVVAVQDLNARV